MVNGQTPWSLRCSSSVTIGDESESRETQPNSMMIMEEYQKEQHTIYCIAVCQHASCKYLFSHFKLAPDSNTKVCFHRMVGCVSRVCWNGLTNEKIYTWLYDKFQADIHPYLADHKHYQQDQRGTQWPVWFVHCYHCRKGITRWRFDLFHQLCFLRRTSCMVYKAKVLVMYFCYNINVKIGWLRSIIESMQY